MNTQYQLDEIFLQNLKSMRNQQLTKMLRCIICEGLFRFAHTLVDCGHTFCQICIFNYIKSFKGRNPAIKCPECHNIVDNNFKRSIMRDVFKQTLVDTLAPQYAISDQIIVKRVQQLFPEFDLQYLFDQFKAATFQLPLKQNRKKIDNNMSSKLIDRIKEKFNVNFQTFCEMIVKQQHFSNFLLIIQNGPPDPKIVHIKPKTPRDLTYIGIDNQMKANNVSLLKLQRFIEKKALQKIDKTEQVPMEWLNTDDNKLNIKIYFQINGQSIDNEDDFVSLLKQHNEHPILYSLTK